MSWLKILYALCLLIAVEGTRRKKFDSNRPEVFRLTHPNGPKLIKTVEEARQICKAAGAKTAKTWMLRDAVRFRGYDYGCDCGWTDRSRPSRPRCGNDPIDKYFTRCPKNPADYGQAGYDVYCFGKHAMQIPYDAVAINIGNEKGYVFLSKQGKGEVIKTESAARALCMRRKSILASVKQVKLAWLNGFSRCDCAWVDGYQSRAMNEEIKGCGNQIRIQGCPHGDMYHAFCYTPARISVETKNHVDFSKLADSVYPLGVEPGAVKISNGYVYETMSNHGYMKTPGVSWAYQSCQEQGATLATRSQMAEALRKGFHSCNCGFIWEQAEVRYGVYVVGAGAAVRAASKTNEKCQKSSQLTSCPVQLPEGSGYNIFCYKQCPGKCPEEKAWKIPPRSVPIDGGRVYHVESVNGKYRLGSKADASAECQKTNGQLATKAQLEMARENGMTRCRCGYTADDFVGFPTLRPVIPCGNSSALHSCPNDFPAIPEQGPNWDAYCFKSDAQMS